LSNLILNAMDAVLDTPRAQRAVTVTTTQDRRFAEICVEDTGTRRASGSRDKDF
jgi:sensor histidine kinase regulating citrate/malate metabolism